MRKLITFIFLMVSISSHAFTTKEMLDVCQSEDRYGPEAALCLGYITVSYTHLRAHETS